MLWNRLEALSGIYYKCAVCSTFIELDDKGEVIIFLNKDGKIYQTIYTPLTESFTPVEFLINGFNPDPQRDGDYILLSFVYNEKGQRLDVHYNDIVAGTNYDPLELWDALLPIDSFAPELSMGQNIFRPDIYNSVVSQSSDTDISGLTFYSSVDSWPGAQPIPGSVTALGIDIIWTNPVTIDSMTGGTTYRIYEEDTLIGETATYPFSWVVKRNTNYYVTSVYRHKYFPYEEFESTKNASTYFSGNQSTGVDYMEISSGITSDTFINNIDDLSYTDYNSIFYPPINHPVVIFQPGNEGLMRNDTYTQTNDFEDFGLTNTDFRFIIIPIYTDPPEHFPWDTASELYYFDVNDLTFTSFNGGFIS